MSFRSFFHRSQPHRKLRGANRGHAGRRPRIEPLESRCLLSLTPVASLNVGTSPQTIHAADFNNDGQVDLVTANSGSRTVSVLLGNEGGTFDPAVDFPTGHRLISIAVGDF